MSLPVSVRRLTLNIFIPSNFDSLKYILTKLDDVENRFYRILNSNVYIIKTMLC